MLRPPHTRIEALTELLRNITQSHPTADNHLPTNNMAHADITFNEAKLVIGDLPSLLPRPNSTNIRALMQDLVNKLINIPSSESTDMGYSGLVLNEDIYLLDSIEPWAGTLDPGYQFKIDVT